MSKAVVVAAECLGVKVPFSRFLHEARINRINKTRYEGQEIEGSLHVTGPDDIVLEIGAGIGLVGAVVLHNARPRAVYSFEANPELIPVINALYKLNGLINRISVQNRLLISAPNCPKAIPFHVRKSYLGSSILNPNNRPSIVVNVPTANFLETCKVLTPTVLIMDIEGGELEILRYADLSYFRAIVVEFHPKIYGVEGMRECKGILRRAGFEREKDKSTRTNWTCVRSAS